jgi:hypothetical protein
VSTNSARVHRFRAATCWRRMSTGSPWCCAGLRCSLRPAAMGRRFIDPDSRQWTYDSPSELGGIWRFSSS